MSKQRDIKLKQSNLEQKDTNKMQNPVKNSDQ